MAKVGTTGLCLRDASVGSGVGRAADGAALQAPGCRWYAGACGRGTPDGAGAVPGAGGRAAHDAAPAAAAEGSTRGTKLYKGKPPQVDEGRGRPPPGRDTLSPPCRPCSIALQ